MDIIELNTQVGEYSLTISWQGHDSKPCSVTITHDRIGVMMYEQFPNSLIASANIRDTLGLGPSIDALTQMGVREDSLLWDLNHSNPHRKS